MSATQTRRLLGLGAVAVAVPLLLAPLASGRSNAKAITVTITDTSFRLSSKVADVGNVTFTVRNKGKAKHNFKVGVKKTPILAPGKGAKLVVKFAKAGKVAYVSTVPGDAKKGLRGTLTVKGAATTGGNTAAGKTVFVNTGCGACHVLKAAGANGTIGPNLDTAPLTKALIVSRVSNGKGSMPSFSAQLSAQQISDVTDFILASRG